MKHQTSRDPKRLCDCDRCMSALHSEIGANPYLNKKLYRRQPRANPGASNA